MQGHLEAEVVAVPAEGAQGDDDPGGHVEADEPPLREAAPPVEPGFHAFCYTVPDADAAPSFVVAGSGESVEGAGTYRENTVAYGDTSLEGMLKKGRHVLGEMERRMALLGFGWSATTGVQAYTVYPMPPALTEEIVARGAARHGLTWQDCRPPVEGRVGDSSAQAPRWPSPVRAASAPMSPPQQ